MGLHAAYREFDPLEPSDASQEIRDAGQVQQLLQALRQSGSANLYLEDTAGVSWPVRLLGVQAGHALRLDIGAAAEIRPMLRAGTAFRLVGEAEGAMVRTAPLLVHENETAGGCGPCLCEYPEALEVAFRRTAFRADLTPTMDVPVDLALPGCDEAIRGALKNLSMGGCLIQLALAAAVKLYKEEQTVRLIAYFPNGQRLDATGHIRHVRPDDAWTTGLLGYEFVAATQAFDRHLWYLVHEIERQRACEQSESNRTLAPSELFQAAHGIRSKATTGAGRTTDTHGPAARRLVKITASLDAQLLQIQAGAPIAIKPLLRQSDKLLELLRQHRDALLYGLACLDHEPLLIQHGVSVAVRMADLAMSQQIDTGRLSAIVACALIHDFGKALLPATILQSPDSLTTEQRTALHSHVPLLTARLSDSDTLPSDIVAAVIEQGNERLDGSGYPRALRASDLSGLARMMAVVDVADAMRRDRADREARPQVEVYRHLLLAQTQFDNSWVQRYIRRFGMIPIGTLAKYSSGRLAWVQRLDDQGKPAQVKVVMNLSDRQQRLEQILHEDDLERLGRFESIVEPNEYGLKP